MSNVFWVTLAVTGAVYVPLFWWLIRTFRRSSRKAMVKRRLLVKEDGQPVWCTVRGRLLVGSSGSKQQVDWGRWADQAEWVVVQAAQDKLVAYRFDDRPRKEPRTGTIQVCNSWQALEAVVPPAVFEDALLAAGVKKPDEYREVPLQL
jgi:hypothetical protein